MLMLQGDLSKTCIARQKKAFSCQHKPSPRRKWAKKKKVQTHLTWFEIHKKTHVAKNHQEPCCQSFEDKVIQKGLVKNVENCFREDTPVEAAAPALGEPMDLMTALQLVMKKSSAHDGLVKGLREAAKAIEKHAAQLCVLAEDCDQPDYVKLLCKID